ncbi:F-box family protein [Dorcoceras hygrometricum]|uniref:F-box family protein n=1 Tax=Dorcoceras hygrometricum TaxID=472368 RepID=A0A2Z7D747_9LAMI|nr:F-box family protein [Dorcoceras hygrometricum]
MYCCYLLVSLESCTCWFLAQNYLLNLSVKAKHCRINLFKRHRFAIANSKYHLLVNSSLRLDTSSCTTSLYLLRLHHPTTGSTIASCYCDDFTDDVIIVDSRSCASSQLLIVMTSSLLLIASSRIYADIITVILDFFSLQSNS